MVGKRSKSLGVLALLILLTACSNSKAQFSEHQNNACSKIKFYIESVSADERSDDYFGDAYIPILREALNEAELEQEIAKSKFTDDVISTWQGGIGSIRTDIAFTLGFQRDGLYVWNRIFSRYCK